MNGSRQTLRRILGPTGTDAGCERSLEVGDQLVEEELAGRVAATDASVFCLIFTVASWSCRPATALCPSARRLGLLRGNSFFILTRSENPETP